MGGIKKVFKISDEEIKQMYLDGNSMYDIAKVAQDTKGLMALRQRLIDLGVDTHYNGKKYRYKFSNVLKKYHFDENYFDIIDNEHKAYWFGLLMADGYNNESKSAVSLKLHKQDKELLEKFKSDLNYEGPIYDIKRKVKNEVREYCELHLNSVVFSEQLAKLGCIQRKTYILEFPKLPKQLIHHFIRGYFDGDGCISITKRKDRKRESSKTYQLNFVGRKEFIEVIKDYICINTGVKRTTTLSNKNNFAKTIHWSGRNVVLKIMNYLYKDSTIYMKIKHDKYLQLYSNTVE